MRGNLNEKTGETGEEDARRGEPPTLGSETATAGPTPPAARSEPVEIDHGQGEPKARPLELPPPAAAERPAQGEQGGLVVVGIGASAGGLEALSELIRYVPIDHLAYIVVQHLAPHHESILTQLLARDSRLEILTATDGMVLEANRVYVIPPNADLAVLQGVLRVFTPPPYTARACPSTTCSVRSPMIGEVR
jgi:chemotaxis response regulator CheB